MNVNIIRLERFDKLRGDAVSLQTSLRRTARYQADTLGEGKGIVDALTVPFPTASRRNTRLLAHLSASRCFRASDADHLTASAAGGSDPGRHLAITFVERDGDANTLHCSCRRSLNRSTRAIGSRGW